MMLEKSLFDISSLGICLIAILAIVATFISVSEHLNSSGSIYKLIFKEEITRVDFWICIYVIVMGVLPHVMYYVYLITDVVDFSLLRLCLDVVLVFGIPLMANPCKLQILDGIGWTFFQYFAIFYGTIICLILGVSFFSVWGFSGAVNVVLLLIIIFSVIGVISCVSRLLQKPN